MKNRLTKVVGIVCAVGFFMVFDCGTALEAAASAVSTAANLSAVSIQEDSPRAVPGGSYAAPRYTVPHAGTSSVRLYGSSNIPSSFDLRTQNKLTSVKNQGSEGDCWAYAAMGSLESSLMPTENDDFSESAMENNSGFDLGASAGGNDQMSTAYLARWSGPAAQSGGSGVQKHVQNVDWLPARSGYGDTAADNAIKQEILAGTAVTAPLYYNGGYYNSGTSSYYYNGSSVSNHEVDVVGWDDAYPASNFAGGTGGTPAHNGAFICRNSWGTGWGASGYFYVSYDDTALGQDGSSAFNSAESTGNYSEIYQYDPLGFTASTPDSSGIQWMANVFQANDNNSLAAVSFYTLAPSMGYQVYVIPQYTGSLSGSTRTLVASGSESSAGYHTVALSAAVALTQGSPFAVEVRFTTSGASIPLEMPISGYSSKATASAGQSYISADGNGWADTTKAFGNLTNVNVCLKAFTKASASSGGSTGSGSPAGGSSSSGGSSTGGSSSAASSVTPNPSLPAMTDVDSPSASMQYGNVTVSGWALSGWGINRIDVYLDLGTPWQKGGYTTKETISRPDVQAMIDPNKLYPNSATSGYSLTIPASDLMAGRHTVYVAAIANDGSVKWAVRDFMVGPEAASNLDSPADTLNCGNVTVSGWALNHAGMNRVDIYVDLGTAQQKFYSTQVNIARPDVKAIIDPYGHYIGSGNSGYSLTIPAGDLSAGRHTVNVAAIGNDGAVQWMVRGFTVGPDATGSLDSPADTWNSGNVTVSGWALNHAGIQRVDVYVDLYTPQQKFYSTSVHLPRFDVRSIVDPNGRYLDDTDSGFSLTIPVGALGSGRHTVNVAAIGNDGGVEWFVRGFTC